MKQNKLLIYLMMFIIILSIANPVSAAIINPNVTSKAALITDLRTGQVIADKNSSKRLPIASISKILVIYMIERAIKDGKIAANQKLTVPADIAEFSEDTRVVNIPLSTSQPYTVRQLEEAALVTSSNSAAMVLANLVSGSQTHYYDDAEKLLASWDIRNAKIYSSSGLKDGDLDKFNSPKVADNKENRLSAREVAIVAKKLLNDFPKITKITSKTETEFPNKNGELQTIKSTDSLLSNKDYLFTGIKTGVTSADGGNFVGITKINDEPVITVILNSGNDNPDKTKFDDTLKMLNEVKNNTFIKSVNDRDSYELIKAATNNGKVDFITNENTKIFVPKNSVKPTLISKLKLKKNVSFPFDTNQTIATKKLKFNDIRINDYLSNEVPSVDYHVIKKINKTSKWITELRLFIHLFH